MLGPQGWEVHRSGGHHGARSDQVLRGGNVGRKIAIFHKSGNAAAHQRADPLERVARYQGQVEVAALAGGEQFDGDDRPQVRRHVEQAARAVGGHRDVIFLVGRRRDGIDARGGSPLLVLRGERGRCHLRDHEAGVEAGARCQKGRQARQRGIDEHGNAAFGQCADLAHGQRHDVGREGDGLGVEVTARQRNRAALAIGDDERVVRHAVGLDRERRCGRAQDIEGRAHHLGLAAQAIGILDAVVAFEMRGTDGAAGHQPAQGIRAFRLAAMGPQGVHAGIERRVGPLGGFRRQHARDERALEQALDLEQRVQRVGRGELRAVEERQTFLRRERQGREAGSC